MATGGNNNVKLVVEILAEAAEFVGQIDQAGEAVQGLAETMEADLSAAVDEVNESLSNVSEGLTESTSGLADWSDELAARVEDVSVSVDDAGQVFDDLGTRVDGAAKAGEQAFDDLATTVNEYVPDMSEVMTVLPETLDEAVRQAEEASKAVEEMAETVSEAVETEIVPATETVVEEFDNIEEAGRITAREVGFAFAALGVVILGLLAYMVKAVDDPAWKERITELKEAWEGLRQAFGQPIVDILIELLPHLTELINRLREWAEENPRLAAGVSFLAFTVGSLMVVMGGVLIYLNMIKAAFVGLGGSAVWGGLLSMWAWVKAAAVAAWGWIVGAVAGIAAFLGLPVWVVGLIIAAVAAAVTAIIVYWDEIKAFFSWLWEWMKEAASDAWGWIKDVATDAWDGIKAAWTAAADWFKGIFKAIGDYWDSLWDAAVKKITDAVAKIKSVWESVTGAVQGGLDSVFDSVVGWFMSGTGGAAGAGMPAFGGSPGAGLGSMMSGPGGAGAAGAGDIFNVTINQLPGEDAGQLLQRLSRELNNRRRR